MLGQFAYKMGQPLLPQLASAQDVQDNIEAWVYESSELAPHITDVRMLAAMLKRTDQDGAQRDWLADARVIAASRQNVQARFVTQCQIKVGPGSECHMLLGSLQHACLLVRTSV